MRPTGPFEAEAVELLKALVETESPTGREDEAVGLFVEAARSMGLEAGRDEAGNGVAAKGEGGRRIYLVGHIDTVPGSIPVRIEGGELWGRGSVDAKGALAAMLVALARASLRPGLEVRLFACVDEEGRSRGARHLLGSAPEPEGVVVGEPSGWEGITVGYRGSALIRITSSVQGIHPSVDEESSAHRVFEVYCKMRRIVEGFGGGDGPFSSPNLRLLRVNTREDGMGDLTSAELNLRIPPSMPFEAFWQGVLEASRRSSALAELLDFSPPVVHDRNSFLAKTLRTCIRERGGRPRMLLKGGTSDMNVLSTGWRCPMVAYGPGDSSLDHTPQERISLEEYLRSIEVLRAFLEAIQGGENP